MLTLHFTLGRLANSRFTNIPEISKVLFAAFIHIYLAGDNMKRFSLLIFLLTILVFSAIIIVTEQHLTNTNTTEPLAHRNIRNRIRVENTDENFTDPAYRVLEWYILRVENSSDYPQETTTYWLFWKGKGVHGDIDAFAEIYNMPNNFTQYTLEIARFTCYELTVYVDNAAIFTFPHIDDDSFNQTQLGYANINFTLT